MARYQGELKAARIPRFFEECLSFGRIVPVEFFEALVPVGVPDPRHQMSLSSLG